MNQNHAALTSMLPSLSFIKITVIKIRKVSWYNFFFRKIRSTQYTEAYPEPSRKSKMEQNKYFRKSSILDVQLGSKYYILMALLTKTQ